MPFPRWTRRLPFRQCQHFEGGSRCSEVSSSFVVPIQRGVRTDASGERHAVASTVYCIIWWDLPCFVGKRSTVETRLCKFTRLMRVLLLTVSCNFRKLPCVCAQLLILTLGCCPASFFSFIFFKLCLYDTS